MQVNQSTSCVLGTVRGMHYQLPPSAEMKLVRCTRGRVWDIVIDLRHNSDTYLRWRAEELSSQNNKMVIIPEGFAHGFQTLEPDCEMLYLHTKEHNPDMERAIRYDDPMIGIKWPVEVSNISERDKNHSYLDDSFKGVMV